MSVDRFPHAVKSAPEGGAYTTSAFGRLWFAGRSAPIALHLEGAMASNELVWRLKRRLKDLAIHAAGMSEGFTIAANAVVTSTKDGSSLASLTQTDRSSVSAGQSPLAQILPATVFTRAIFDVLRTSGPQTVGELRTELCSRGINLRPAEIRRAMTYLQESGTIVRCGRIYSIATGSQEG